MGGHGRAGRAQPSRLNFLKQSFGSDRVGMMRAAVIEARLSHSLASLYVSFQIPMDYLLQVSKVVAFVKPIMHSGFEVFVQAD